MKSYKIFIDSATLLCEGNLVDTSRIYRYAIENGHKVSNNPSEADFIIINSCGFIKSREEESVNLFKKYNLLKKEKASIIMYGCLIKINKNLVDSLDVYAVDLNEGKKFDKLFYNKVKFEDIKPYCDSKTRDKLGIEKNIIQTNKYPCFFITKLMSPFLKKVRLNYKRIVDTSSYKDKILVEISRGCASNCNYCAIKKARGKVNSRSIKEIITDIEYLYDPKKQLFLVADDCSCYGLDIKTNLIDLLYKINEKYPDLLIELDNINPYWLVRHSDEYVKLFKDVKINHVVIPVQSGSNKVLKNMNRQYDIKEVIEVVDQIKKVSPDTFISSHFIMGYPGESTIDFIKSLLCAMHFDLPIFLKYSEHAGSTSSSLFHKKSAYTTELRYNISQSFINFSIFYKLLTFANNKRKVIS